MLPSSKHKHRRTSKSLRYATLAGIAGAAVAVPLLGAAPASAASSSQWDQVAACESGGNWSINTGNGFFGGLQFTSSTWAAYGGTAFAPQANQASKAQQISVAEKVLASQGKGAWPNCGVNLSSSGNSGSMDAAPQQQAPQQQAPQQQAPQQRTESKPLAQETQKSQPQQSTRAAGDQHASRGEHRAPVVMKGDGEYKVVSGDTLSKIAASHHVKGGWKHLFDLNKSVVRDPNMIFPGQQLHLS